MSTSTNPLARATAASRRPAGPPVGDHGGGDRESGASHRGDDDDGWTSVGCCADRQHDEGGVGDERYGNRHERGAAASERRIRVRNTTEHHDGAGDRADDAGGDAERRGADVERIEERVARHRGEQHDQRSGRRTQPGDRRPLSPPLARMLSWVRHTERDPRRVERGEEGDQPEPRGGSIGSAGIDGLLDLGDGDRAQQRRRGRAAGRPSVSRRRGTRRPARGPVREGRGLAGVGLRLDRQTGDAHRPCSDHIADVGQPGRRRPRHATDPSALRR